ncbi:uracil phosphoribosyltransferase [Apibacter muscae]|uniref:Uracil phosphoribosyltransferase n=1 Tax=Apibacter muscae TaxID=2509004 RepID=A0A563D7Q1_9FLAO|nr:uracil phosphoribosyltransferase [Apibacter muscae]TWP22863.1 uracil phosphoribosyltransferase [Apibacter muscae]TWP26256.1 uracil phosphoribosyltransferase [Apibacter muscae]TWP28100.1 uracil phosphoribosyltransferase [Apibacter muscae]
MIIHDFTHKRSILNHFVGELRDVNIQKDRMRFRRNLERIGEVLGYELSKTLDYYPVNINSPLGIKPSEYISKQPVLCTILRAGLPLHQGMMNFFDQAETTFVSAFRNHSKNSKEFEVVVEYLATPSLDNKTLIISDPMLATGESLANVYEVLLKYGSPKKVHIVAAIGSKPGIDYIKEKLPESTELWIASVDEILNEKQYIVPGLGDAGDLAFGKKLH